MSGSNDKSEQNVDLPADMEVTLDDDKVVNETGYSSGALAIGGDGSQPQQQPEVEFRGPRSSMPELSSSEGAGLRRDRPFSASTRSRMSTKSITSLNPSAVQTNFTVKSFFSYRNGGFESAVEELEKQVVVKDMDGDLKGAWLLNHIDHWDNEREKIVMLTDFSMLVCRYDFIAGRLLEHRRTMLHTIDTITVGDFIYPERSLMPPRKHGGIKISWAKGREPTFGQKWNPMTTDIGYVMFAHHPIIYHEKEHETVTYNVDDFHESLIQAINQALRAKNPGQTVIVSEHPILIESYASIASQIFNQSGLGFFKERGGVSF